MDDLISRQAAITLPVIPKEYREYQTFNLDDAYEQGWNDLQKCIESLPSAQKKGHWIERHYIGKNHLEMMVCSNCRTEWSYDAETGVSDYNFCPNCGADMRGDENG